MWNEWYSLSGFAYGTEPNEFLDAAAVRIPAGRACRDATGAPSMPADREVG